MIELHTTINQAINQTPFLKKIMASAQLLPLQRSMASSPAEPISNPSSVKTLAESSGLNSIPPEYTYCSTVPDDSTAVSADDASIPTIDFSLPSSGDPDQRRKVIRDLGKACQDWGFFMVVNHGMPERLIKGIIEVTDEFFNLPEEEKMGSYQTKHVLDPIRYGTSFNPSTDQNLFWRDYLKVFVHPQFHCPCNPHRFRDILVEYAERVRELAGKLLGGISESLGLEEDYIHKQLDLESGQQIFTTNYYPPCPQPELAMGMPPHSDHGLLTLLLQNGVGGLQVLHQGRWLNVNALPDSFLVNTGDHLQIFTNGRYKSVMHRALVNNKAKRISIAVTNGPSLDTNVCPSTRVLGLAEEEDEDEDEGKVEEALNAAEYIGMTYRKYLELQQSNKLDGKSCLDRVKRIPIPPSKP